MQKGVGAIEKRILINAYELIFKNNQYYYTDFSPRLNFILLVRLFQLILMSKNQIIKKQMRGLTIGEVVDYIRKNSFDF